MAKAKSNIAGETSVQKCNKAITKFIAEHSDCVTTWTDKDMMFIQLNYAGVRGTNLNYVSFIANNTLVEDNFVLFGLPCKCIYASNGVIRFCGKTVEMVETMTDENFVRNNMSNVSETLGIPSEKVASIVKSVTTRVESNKQVQKSYEKEIWNDPSKITIYVLSNPQSKYNNGSPYATWTVIGILRVNAGTNFGISTFQNKLKKLRNDYFKTPENDDEKTYGTFNLSFNDSYGPNNIYQDDNSNIYAKAPEFLIGDVKVGDIIDSRNYKNYKVWPSDGYQRYDNDYQAYQDNRSEMQSLIIQDGTVLTI